MSGIEPVKPAELPVALAYVLAPPGRKDLADAAQVAAYREYLSECPVGWEALQLRRRGCVSGLVFALLLPGGVALLMLPTPGEHGIDPGDQAQVQVAMLDRLGRGRLHYVQALLEPEATSKHAVLQQVGFRRLTTLLYLEREPAHPPAGPPHPDEAEWLRFDDQTRDEFAATLETTYEDSLDCPELTGLRPIEDVIASHTTAGPRGAALWELARREDQTLGCLLLSMLTQSRTMEIVYMGVVPASRRRGVGKLLLRRAVQRAGELGAKRMLVVVDERNTPARSLYERFGFATVAARDVYLYRQQGRRVAR
jgi:ribosomal protein S18 acetylase RimI-like enzyme